MVAARLLLGGSLEKVQYETELAVLRNLHLYRLLYYRLSNGIVHLVGPFNTLSHSYY